MSFLSKGGAGFSSASSNDDAAGTYSVTGSYGDLTGATAGPSVTLVTGTTALILFGAMTHNTNSAGFTAYISVAVSGASTIAAADSFAAQAPGIVQNLRDFNGVARKMTGLTAGSNTFTLKYRVDGANFSFQQRYIVVVAL